MIILAGTIFGEEELLCEREFPIAWRPLAFDEDCLAPTRPLE